MQPESGALGGIARCGVAADVWHRILPCPPRHGETCRACRLVRLVARRPQRRAWRCPACGYPRYHVPRRRDALWCRNQDCRAFGALTPLVPLTQTGDLP